MATSIHRRYIAIGDSSTEGLDDPDGRGGYRGWSHRLANRLAIAQGSIEYANFAVRGRTTRQILDQQLPPALALAPDLVSMFSGTNDVIARRFDLAALARDLEALQRPVLDIGATVLTFTLPDLTPVMPVARWLAPRVESLNQVLRELCGHTGALLVDFAAHPVGSDPRLWSEDRLHANSQGHARIADALAHALGLPGTDMSWATPLPPLPPQGWVGRACSELSWARLHLLPWLGRHTLGRSSGDGRGPKQPELRRIVASKTVDALE